jgi:hypothetical protein
MVVSALLMLALIPGTALAAPTPKVDVCHFDKRADTRTLTSVAATSLGAHLAHGDALPGEGGYDASCRFVPPARVFARAWADVGVHNKVYDAGTDVLYAEVVDTNANNVADAGDTYRVNVFPVDFTGGTIPVGVTSHVVTGIALGPGELWLDIADGSAMFRTGYESYQEASTTSVVVFSDNGGLDMIWIEPNSPSQPQTSEEIYEQRQNNDDAWLEVSVSYP